MDDKLLKSEERAVFQLRSLYKKYGYLPYRMSKFEEYELYIRNRDFLVSDRIITFNDTNGKLLALKPDVTLSIIKSGEDVTGVRQKVYYNENVYRVSESTHRYKEIMQTGLECIGSIGLYDVYEVISLAAQSLAVVQEDFKLQISHLGILTRALQTVFTREEDIHQALTCISRKNRHDLQRLWQDRQIDEQGQSLLLALIQAYGERTSVIRALKPYVPEEVLLPLVSLNELLNTSPYSESIIYDFSVVNDMNYYTGFVFKGFLKGLPGGVLAGGQYDKLMQKMGRTSGAVGFAIYLDMLERLEPANEEYDVDCLLLYDASVSAQTVALKVSALLAAGMNVSAQNEIPPKLRYRKLMDLRGGKAE